MYTVQCTKPSTCNASKSRDRHGDSSSAAVSADTHEITDAVTREIRVLQMLLRLASRLRTVTVHSRGFENVWPPGKALSSTQARNVNICVRPSQLSMPESLGSSFSDADSFSLSAKHRTFQQKKNCFQAEFFIHHDGNGSLKY